MYSELRHTIIIFDYEGVPKAIINKKGKTTSRITFNVFKMEMRPSLIEFLEQDWKVNVSLAIDFTLSNLEIQDQRSLSTFNTHMRRPSSMFAT